MRVKAKSKAVRKLIDEIYTSPNAFKAERYHLLSSLVSKTARIKYPGGPRFSSAIDLEIHDVPFPLSYRDRWALEVAVDWWFTVTPITELIDAVKIQ